MILGDENNDLVSPTTNADMFSRNMVIAMENLSTYLRPYLTKADKDMIDYAKFNIVDDPVQLSYDFLKEFVSTRKVITLELMILVIESIIRSSGKVKRGVFRLDPSVPGPSPGKIIFVKWLSYAMNLIEESRNSSQTFPQTNKDDVEAMVIVSVMELICAMTEVIQKPKQIEVLKTKFGVDWIFIVDTVLSFATANNISTIQTSAINAKGYLEKIIAGQEFEKYAPKAVPPYKVTQAKKSTEVVVADPLPKSSYVAIENSIAPISTEVQQNAISPVHKPLLQRDGTWNATKSAGWHNFKGPKRKATLHSKATNGLPSPHKPTVHRQTSQVPRESNPYPSNKRGYPDKGDDGQRKRNRPSDTAPYGGRSAVPRDNSINSSIPNQSSGRGRGMTLPAWMTKDTAPVATSYGSDVGTASSSAPQPVEMGRGRGRDRTLPAWMAKSESSNASGIRPERDHNRPTSSSENYRSEQGRGDRNFPSSSGRGRGRDRTIPAWQTSTTTSSVRDQPSDRNPPANPGRGRGRGMTLPSWMTKTNESNPL
jgi:hypothetical protein